MNKLFYIKAIFTKFSDMYVKRVIYCLEEAPKKEGLKQLPTCFTLNTPRGVNTVELLSVLVWTIEWTMLVVFIYLSKRMVIGKIIVLPNVSLTVDCDTNKGCDLGVYTYLSCMWSATWCA